MKKVPKKKRVGFVASGGAAKAACFHMGVALALQRKGFEFRTGLRKHAPMLEPSGREIEVMVGSSAGAFACALIASGHPLEEIYHSFLGHRNSRFPTLGYGQMLNPNLMDTLLRYVGRLPKSLAVRGTRSFESLIQAVFCSNGLCTTEKLERYLRRDILPANRFEELHPELYMVTTLLDNPGRLILGPRKLRENEETFYATEIEVSHAAAASMSLPPVFKPYPLETAQGTTYCFDGEIRKTLSTHIAKDAGCDLIIVSYTHSPYRYREDVGSLVDFGIPSILVQALYQLIESRIQGAKRQHDTKVVAAQTIGEFFARHQLPKHLRDELLNEIYDKLGFNPEVEYIFIHPTAHEDDLFFADHFNLSPKAMEAIAEQGFRSAIRILKDYSFTFSDPLTEFQAS